MAKDINWRSLFPPPDTRFDRYKETNPRPPGGVPWFFDKMPTPKPRPKPAYPKDVHPGTGLPSWIWKHLEDRPKETHPRPMPERGGDPWLPLPGMPGGIPPRGTYPGGIQTLPYRPNPEFSDMPSIRPLSFASGSVVPKPRFSPIRNPYQEKGAASSYGYEDERGNWVDVLDGNREPIVGGKRIPTAQEQVKGVMGLPDEKSKAFSKIHHAYSTGADFGYEPDWASRLNVPDGYIELYMAVPDAAKKYAYDNPTDSVLEQFEEKYGFPLNISIPLK